MNNRLLWTLAGACLMAAPASAQSGATAAPTWNKEIAPIVYANCITCHRPGEVAPMSLTTFAEARPWAKGIKAKVMAHEMPPWFADPRYGKFQNKRGLTQAQIDALAR
jgi:mono/diheme cytochrome c family protein